MTLHVESLIESGVDQSKIAVIAPYNLQVGSMIGENVNA